MREVLIYIAGILTGLGGIAAVLDNPTGIIAIPFIGLCLFAAYVIGEEK